MHRSHPLEVMLSGEALRFIRRKVSTGQHASPSAVIQEALELLQAQDGDFEDWLRDEGKPVAEYFRPQPARSATPASSVERYLEEQRRLRAKAG